MDLHNRIIITTESNLNKLFIFSVIVCFMFSCSNEYSEFAYSVEAAIKDVKTENNSIAFLDVRSLEEHYGELGHLPGSTLIPQAELGDRISDLSFFESKKVIVYSNKNERSIMSMLLLRENGFEAFYLNGGMSLVKEKFPNF